MPMRDSFDASVSIFPNSLLIEKATEALETKLDGGREPALMEEKIIGDQGRRLGSSAAQTNSEKPSAAFTRIFSYSD
jgi:hypothetical protein